MYGYVEEGTRGALAAEEIAGGLFLHLTLPRSGLFCSCQRKKGWQQLYRAGVRCAVLPVSLTEEAARWGINPVPVYPLRRELLAAFLDRCGTTLQGAAVGLQAEYVSAEVVRAAELLAVRARYLLLHTGAGSDELAAYLHRRFGLAVGGAASAVLTVRFGCGAGQGRCLCLGEDCAAQQQVVYDTALLLPQGERETDEQLLSALFALGAVKKEQIPIKRWSANA